MDGTGQGTTLDDFTARHLADWWQSSRHDDETYLYGMFLDYVASDLDYWSEHGWPSAWRAFELQQDEERQAIAREVSR